MTITIKKESPGVYNVFIRQGKTKKQIAKIEDTHPHIKQTTNKPKAFFLWVNHDGVFFKHKISWFYSMQTVKQWLRESITTLGYDGWTEVNNLDRPCNNHTIQTVLNFTAKDN